MGSPKQAQQTETVPVYQSTGKLNSASTVTAAVAQDISSQNQALAATQAQLRKRTGGIMSTYERFQSNQSGKTKLGQ